MIELKHSIVQRSGVTARYWDVETANISVKAREGLDFRFNIASKGGGKTDIQLTVGKDDLPALLLEIAKAHPDLSAALAESTLLAINNA